MRVLALAAVVIGLLAAPSASPAAVPMGFFGFSVEGALFRPEVNMSAQFSRMTKVGAEAVMTEVNWNFMQPEEDRPPDFTRIDRVMLNASRRGITVLANVLYAPRWAAVNPRNGATPPKPAPYAAFLRELVLRYGPSGSFWAEHPEITPVPIRDWQVWNEPNLTGFWSEQPYQKDYIELLKASNYGIKLTDPGARVVLAGLVGRSWDELRKIYRAGGKGLFDVVSLHPFTSRPVDVLKIIRLNRDVMAANGNAKLPVIISEMSWPSGKGKTKTRYTYEVTPKEQAARIRQMLPMLAKARRSLRIERVLWHSWLTKDSGPYAFDYAGLRRLRGAKISDKPGLAAYRTTVLALEGCKRKGTTVARCG